MDPLTLNPDLPGGPIPLPTDRDLPYDDSGGEPVALRQLPTGFDLPYDDGEPMESPWHRDNMGLLLNTIKTHWRGRNDFYAGGNMFIYFSAERVFGRDFRGPDFFVVKGVDRNRPRVSWVVWDEKGKTPDVIVELLSPTTAAVDRGPKKLLYESVFRTREYYCYEPSTDRLEAWRLATGAGYQPISPDASGRLWSEELELALGTWDGAYEDTHARWVRFFKADGTLVPTSLEASQAENERLRKENEVLRKQQVPPPTP